MGVDEVARVIKLEMHLLDPQTRRARSQVEWLLDPDFREIGASGRLWTRAEMIAALAGEDDASGPIPAVDVVGTLLGPDLILLTYVSDPQGRAARRSSLWRRTSGTWRLLHHQGTLMKRP